MTARRLRISKYDLSEKISELYWSIGNSQLSIGYSLLCLGHCEYPSGVSGMALSEPEIPNAIDISEIHFWYHLHNSKESIYRSYERIKAVLRLVCYPLSNKKIYLNALINEIKNDTRYNNNPKLKELVKLEGLWNEVAEIRNKSSHQESSPMKSMDIEGKESILFGSDGDKINYLAYKYENLNNELQKIKDIFNKLLPSIKRMKEFIDNINIQQGNPPAPHPHAGSGR